VVVHRARKSGSGFVGYLLDEIDFAGLCRLANANSSQLLMGPLTLGGAELPPLDESGGSAALEELASGEAAVLAEVVTDGGMSGGELLQASDAPQVQHRTHSSPEREM